MESDDRCLCLAREVTDEDIDHYEIGRDGKFWAVYRDCPLHHNAPQYQLIWCPSVVARTRETAPVETTGAVQQRTEI